MLDNQPKPRIGASLDDALLAWRQQVQLALAETGAPQLGSGIDILRQIPPEGIGQTLLSQQIGLTKQAVQQGLDLLEAQGLVRREVLPEDKRAKRVLLTEAGLAALAARLKAEKVAERMFREALGKKRFSKLRKALKAISNVRADASAD